MAGMSDSGQPDDVKLHLEVIQQRDAQRHAAPPGETDDEREKRESELLPADLRARLDRVLADVSAQVPGLSAAEVAKLTATKRGREAQARGEDALARVDSHLQARTGERNPVAGKRYGVYGANPETFAGVLRALGMSSQENNRVRELPDGDPGKGLLFTPVVARAVNEALAEMSAVAGQKTGTRGGLSHAVTLKDATLQEARAVISATRLHLYANLPDRHHDDELRAYGFRPTHPGIPHRRGGADEPTPGAAGTAGAVGTAGTAPTA